MFQAPSNSARVFACILGRQFVPECLTAAGRYGSHKIGDDLVGDPCLAVEMVHHIKGASIVASMPDFEPQTISPLSPGISDFDKFPHEAIIPPNATFRYTTRL